MTRARNKKKMEDDKQFRIGNCSSEVDDAINDDVSSAPCAKCEVVIPGDGNGLFCDGFCGSWYHPGCMDIDEEIYDYIDKSSEYVKWYCKECAGKVTRKAKEILFTVYWTKKMARTLNKFDKLKCCK